MEHTILVVEDEQGIREAIGIYMKNQGYNVILAANGKEGLEKIETNDIHLAIVDIMSLLWMAFLWSWKQENIMTFRFYF